MVKDESYREVEKKLRNLKKEEVKLEYYYRYNYVQVSSVCEMEKLKENVKALRSAINSLDKIQRDLIIKYYVENKSLLSISEELGYSLSYCSRMKSKAVRTLVYIMM